MLQNGGSKKQTAEKLYLHRNTMMYRVKKIEEILKCNIGDFYNFCRNWHLFCFSKKISDRKREGKDKKLTKAVRWAQRF